jgi:NAD(P)-dependent dehydrogenase (short-subunit alcohol dehydrogenase family)
LLLLVSVCTCKRKSCGYHKFNGRIQGSLKFAGLAAYSSSKGAVITLSELLAEEYKERGISFNVLALGAVQTEMLEEAFLVIRHQ